MTTERIATATRSDVARAVRASNLLTARWALARAEEPGALSGVGVWPLLAFLASASDGWTRNELAQAVDLPAEQTDLCARALLAALRTSRETALALGVWTRRDLPLTEWWQEAVPVDARGYLTGDPARDTAALGNWAHARTNGMVDRLPLQVTPETLLVLASALHVDTRWTEPFDEYPHRITEGPWASQAPVAGLSRTSTDIDHVTLLESSTGPVTMLTVPGDGDVDVNLLLGAPGCLPGEVLHAGVITAEGDSNRRDASTLPLGTPGPGLRVEETASTSPLPRLRVSTPCFTVRTAHDLLDHGPLFGLTCASTTTRGHFPRLSPEPLAVESAAQEVTASFSARGFEAAAVTSLSAVAGCAMPTETHRVREVGLTFDRPFGFTAVHRPTGLVLLAGWVSEPEAWQGD